MNHIHVTTSNRYLHLLPVFAYCLNKYMPGFEVNVVGYDAPKPLPDNFTFHSLGKQGDVTEWSTDLRRYFESVDDQWFLWMMEDSFVRSFNDDQFTKACSLTHDGVGRINLTNDAMKREHTIDGFGIVWAGTRTQYRLSTQVSIWNKEFLLKYLTPGLNPWQFEVKDAFDGTYSVVGVDPAVMKVNEGVRKWDPHALDLNGFTEEDVKHINSLL